MPIPSLLIVDDNQLDLEIISMVCMGMDCTVSIAKDGEQALTMANEKTYDVILSDYKMEPMNGVELVLILKKLFPDTSFLIVTGFPDAEVREFTKDASYCDLVTKPIQVDSLMNGLRVAIGKKRGATGGMDPIAFSNRMDSCLALVGESAEIRKVRFQLKKALVGHDSLLIEGPVGIGKREIARLVRDYGPYGKSHFVECYCGDMNEQELSQKLISRDGIWGTILTEAVNGCLALYNVEALPLKFQMALAKEFSIITESIYVIAQAHCSLEDMMMEGTFDMKLFFELSSCSVRLPALADRMEDVDQLVRFVVGASRRFDLERKFNESEINKLIVQIKEESFVQNVDDLVLAVKRFSSE